MKMHTFTVYVEDRPGVLNRVSSLFRRRGYNIVSLAVGHSETPGVSRMTLVVETDAGGAQRIAAHLYKLIHVIRVEDITDRRQAEAAAMDLCCGCRGAAVAMASPERSFGDNESFVRVVIAA